jgi:putative Mn2+ efflux pump MntP
MDIVTPLLLGVALAMDAFAVSIIKGLMSKKSLLAVGLATGAWFGFFQFLMPCLGFVLGSAVYDLVSGYAHWIAFAILLLIGLNMIREDFFGEEDGNGDMGVVTMATLAVATSIDAFVVGISMSMESTEVLIPAIIIGAVTFAISFCGAVIGRKFGADRVKRAGTIGGCILIIIGVKTLLSGLGFFRGRFDEEVLPHIGVDCRLEVEVLLLGLEEG